MEQPSGWMKETFEITIDRHVEVSINGGTPKLTRENPIKIIDYLGVPLFQETTTLPETAYTNFRGRPLVLWSASVPAGGAGSGTRLRPVQKPYERHRHLFS